jgi:two-component system chemotaxis sensor kinase CheA
LEATPEVVRREIRVDTGKLDKLFELVGELITAESMVANSPDLVGLHLDSFNKSISSLSKISREIQETTMMIRMIPLEGLFQKMTRLVRDLSRKFGKPVNLLVSGQDTEMDKNVIEQVETRSCTSCETRSTTGSRARKRASPRESRRREPSS